MQAAGKLVTPILRRRRRKAQPKRTPGGHYTLQSYGRSIARACRRAGVMHWHPHQLRHTRGTEFRSREGVEVAQVLLGHESLSATQVYAEKDRMKAIEVMRRIG